MKKRQIYPADWAEKNRSEWDFSRLTHCKHDQQLAAWEWEIERERIRKSKKPPLSILGYPTPEYSNTPWLSLTSSQRKQVLSGCPEPCPVRELDHGEDIKLIREAANGNELPGTKLHTLALCWKGHSLEEIVDALTELAKKWRKAERDKSHPREQTPIAWLWNLSCYRLFTLGGYDYAQIQATLNSLPKFKDRRTAFSPDSARKSASAIRSIVE